MCFSECLVILDQLTTWSVMNPPMNEKYQLPWSLSFFFFIAQKVHIGVILEISYWLHLTKCAIVQAAMNHEMSWQIRDLFFWLKLYLCYCSCNLDLFCEQYSNVRKVRWWYFQWKWNWNRALNVSSQAITYLTWRYDDRTHYDNIA